jgi:lysozyme
MAITDNLVERTKKHEGYRREPYKDTVGKWTVGYGRNLEDNPLTVDEVLELFDRTEFKNMGVADTFFEKLLLRDIELHKEELEENLAMFPMCDQDEQTVLIDMAFNVGVPTLLHFQGMLHAIDNDDRVQAAIELLDSRYAEQVKTRAVDNAKLLAGGKFSEVLDGLEKKNPRRYKILEGYL